jgi:hypothetical protein
MDSDSSGMGRWSSVRLWGKNQRRFVTAYRCVKNFHGPLSAWNQQQFILDSCNQEEDPIEAFDTDIIVCLKQWIETGDQIILGIDVYEDIRSGTFARWISLECATTTNLSLYAFFFSGDICSPIRAKLVPFCTIKWSGWV